MGVLNFTEVFQDRTLILDIGILNLSDVFPIEFAVPVCGILSPIVICISIILNVLVLLLFLQKHMRSPTNVTLAGIAVSDIVTVVFALPFYVLFFGLENYKEHISYEWCIYFFHVYSAIPVMFHTASIWQTLMVTIQRFLYIRHPVQAKTWCTIPNIVRMIILIYIVAILTHCKHFFTIDVHRIELSSKLTPNTTVIGCNYRLKPWYRDNFKVNENVYLWFRVIFINLIPCVTLLVLNIKLIATLKDARKRRKQLFGGNQSTDRACTKPMSDLNTQITLMLIIIISAFLLVEIPVAIDMILFNIHLVLDEPLYTGETERRLVIIINFFVLCSCTFNFFIYCGLYRQFRMSLKNVITGKHPQITHRR